MKKKICGSYEELWDYLAVLVKSHAQEEFNSIAIIGGHYALNAEGEAAVNPEDKGSFGIFPRFTLGLAARLVQKGRELRSDTKLVMVVDDHSQMPDRQWYLQKAGIDADIRDTVIKSFMSDVIKGVSPTPEVKATLYVPRVKNWEEVMDIAQIVGNYFRNYVLPPEYKQILQKYGLTESDFLHSERGLPFQETRYRERFYQETGLDPGCAGEYRLILEELAGKGIRKVIAFLPLCCKEPTCTAISYYFADKKNIPLVNVNVYLSSSEENESPEQLLEEMLETTGGIVVMREG